MLRRTLIALAACVSLASPALAWDADGHRMITRAALDAAAKDAAWPAWLNNATTRDMITDQAVTPDRWRSTKVGQLTHLNNPDHYVDIEQLADFGLTIDTIPRLRHEYVRQLTLAREKPGFKGEPINPARDPNRVNEYPGFLPFAACEAYGKIVSALRTVRILERANDPARAPQLQMARADAMTHMGILAHYLGDAAQPLHTTIHHHGWIGDNPNRYTTDRGIHSFIDGKILDIHKIADSDVSAAVASFADPVSVEPRDPWDAVIAELKRSFEQVEPLYVMKKSGDLEQAPGKPFIVGRLADGARTLGAVYAAAAKASNIDEQDMAEFWRYDGTKAEKAPPAAPGS